MTALPSQVSIRTRLALLYTALLAGALLVFGTGAFLVLRQDLTRSFDANLAANAEHAAGAFAQDVGAGGQLEPSRRLLEQLASTGGRIVVFDASRSSIADSAPPGTPGPPLTTADFEAADRHQPTIAEFTTPAGDARRLVLEPILAADGVSIGYVAWADSTAPLDELLRTVGLALLLGGLLVTALALIAGLALARRALAPVADLTETARAIALSGDFAARVEGGGPGDEVGELAVAFNEMLAALERNHRTLQRFLGDASHELRTPLTSIRANLDLARRGDVPEHERLEILSDARDEAERMGRLVADLLSLARADSGVSFEFVPVELDRLLVESVHRQAQAASHVQMTVASVEPAIVDGDRDRLRELIGILLDNAARYTPPGGSVRTRLAVRDGHAVLTVEDTGIGLGDEDHDRLFERLYRGQRARAMRPSGTGLGLAIARWIVETHAGTIELGDRPGGGTLASIRLPLRA